MSRETDSSSSGPHGRGGAAYPSGTPPYGTPTQGAAAPEGADEGRPGAGPPSDERKTETTLTTRIRINIPGSRPIPPVVMRTPMSDADASALDGDRDGNGGAGHGGTNGSGTGMGPAPAGSPAPGSPSGNGSGPAGSAGPAGPAGEKTSDWFAPRKSGPPPGGSGTGAPPASANGASGGGSSPGAGLDPLSGDQRHGELPYFTQNTQNGQGHGPNGLGGPIGPSGPTGGPVGGDGPLTAPRMNDDTAILTPQQPAPVPPGGHGVPGGGGMPDGAGDNVSGHTLTSGIPVVPSAQNAPFAPGAHPEGPVPHTPPKLPEPVQQNLPPASDRSSRPKKKGRNKLVLLVVGLFVIGGFVYGAGLLLNHSDVPKGTTVLGVDIGGGTRDEAVKKLDAAFGDRITKPMQLAVDGKKVPLRPDQAGLTLDTDATVQAAAVSDYNPVSVIGSLFGQERVVEPVMPVDEEKLRAQLARAVEGSASGSANDGTITFEPGKAVAVYGKPGKGIDVAGSTTAVEEAYRTQVETGGGTPVPVAVTTQQPSVSKEEVDRMMKEFAEPAMSGLVTIKAGAASIPFGPEKSLPQILSVTAIDGKLVEKYDKAALKKLYGTTFDGVLITRATGQKTAVTPEDVIGVLRQVLRGKTPAERIGTIETNPA
ncbi:hypothetical protein ACIQNU_12910 [Streptomyces sp. NPDC091292]|uniref:hypothetical protein n=1 Tax=Streptomyces sp. NPDC091292 TaxID=3365991 RepID=UPI003823FC57